MKFFNFKKNLDLVGKVGILFFYRALLQCSVVSAVGLTLREGLTHTMSMNHKMGCKRNKWTNRH